MAEVFFAKSFGVRGFQRLLVIKRILPNLTKDEEFVEMFIDEAKISVELNHANICQVTDFGKIDGNYFIAMEFVNGKDMRALLKKAHMAQKKIPVEMAMYVIAETLKGLHYAHKREDTISGKSYAVIHRDISPQNVMISYKGDIKIVDFGIAKTNSKQHRTQAGVLKGKFAYMSPEQGMGMELDARTDIFSAAIILYEMLAGARLFLGETDFETLENIKECAVPSLKPKNPLVSDALEDILLKALSKKAADRFATALDMQLALNRLLYTEFPDFNPQMVSSFMQDLFQDDIQGENTNLKKALSKISDDQIQSAESASEADQDNQSHHTILSPEADPFINQPKNKLWTRLFGVGWIGKASFIVLLAFAFYMGLKKIILKDHAASQPQSQVSPETPRDPDPNLASPQATELSFSFSTVPSQADIYLNGDLKGKTPLELILPLSQFYDLQIKRDGYLPIQKQWQSQEGQQDLVLQLEKIKPTVGTLDISSKPSGAKILIDNEDSGLDTPAELENLELNRTYKIVLKKQGYRDLTKNVVMEQVDQEVTLALAKKTGTIKVNTSPSSVSVSIDGKKKSKTTDALDIGKTYTVKVSKSGYHSVTRKVSLDSNFVELDIELKKRVIKKGSLSISATPWAQVIIGGNLIGTSPILNHTISVGKHEVTLRHPDFNDVKKNVVIREGENQKIIIDLRNP